MSSKRHSKFRIRNVDFESSYRCRTCKKSFREFISFEGHFAFNALCRARNGWFMQCYLCGQKFHYVTELKYHLRRHVKDEPNQLKQIVNRSIEKRGKRKSTSGLRCSTCKTSFRSNVQLVKHVISHCNKETSTHKHQRNEVAVVSQLPSSSFKCQICNMLCADRMELEKHLMEHMNKHLNKETPTSNPVVNRLPSSSFKCQICNVVCAGRIELEEHNTTHAKSKLRCEKCQFTFTTEMSLKIHQKVSRRCNTTGEPNGTNVPEQLQCDICKAKFAYSYNLIKHKLMHVDGKEECNICHIKFTKTALALHEREVHSQSMDDEVPSEGQQDDRQNDEATQPVTVQITQNRSTPNTTQPIEVASPEIVPPIISKNTSSTDPTNAIVCKQCDLSFTTNFHLRQHRLAHGQYPCYKCDKVLNTFRGLRKHYKSHNCSVIIPTNVSSTPPGTTVVCDRCDTSFTSNLHLRQHKIARGQFSCKICDKVLCTRTSMRKHCRSHTSTNTSPQNARVCKRCESSFTSNLHLRQHEIARGQFSCKICDKVLCTRTSLEKHCQSHKSSAITSSHATQNALYCELCDISVASISRLRQHIRAHGQYPCKKCDKVLYTYRSLRKHCQSHNSTIVTSHRQCSCEISDYSLHSLTRLQKHCRTHTLECYLCKTSFPSAKKLIAHTNKHIVYEQWVDPINVSLSNWNQEQSREIVQNQPLVMVDNLNIHEINMNLSPTCDESTIEIESDNIEDGTEVPSDDDKVVIEISSESDVDDILELFYCYFCQEIFRSLDTLGIHEKECTFRP